MFTEHLTCAGTALGARDTGMDAPEIGWTYGPSYLEFSEGTYYMTGKV